MTARKLHDRLRQASPDALVAYLTGGYPDPDAFFDVLLQVAAEVDVVEIGIPFTDPMADGVTLQATSAQALERGTTLTGLLDRLAELKIDTPIVCMSYLNPLLSLGERLVPSLVRAGVSGLVVPDLPFEECGPLDRALDEAALALIQLIAPTTPLERASRLAASSRGFVYVVTSRGVTGGDASLPEDLGRRLSALRACTDVPVLAGFGIRRAEQVQALRAHSDGVIVGSALMNTLTQGRDPVAFLRGLRNRRTE
ncbi:MAG: tryptophan synthase alpha chain [Kiritimatiellia bacterium]|jgi:tryptophan synthase alpha chain